jgi:hypothetical protein
MAAIAQPRAGTHMGEYLSLKAPELHHDCLDAYRC